MFYLYKRGKPWNDSMYGHLNSPLLVRRVDMHPSQLIESAARTAKAVPQEDAGNSQLLLCVRSSCIFTIKELTLQTQSL